MKPYDVVEKEEELELKKNPNSAVHIVLPDGTGDEIYKNAERELQKAKDKKLIKQDEHPAIYMYRQESPSFSHEGLLMGVSLDDYEKGNIKKHEHTREKPLKDRTAHIAATKMNTGLVWTVFKKNKRILSCMKQIKKSQPVMSFEKYGYRNIVWKTEDIGLIEELKNQFKSVNLYIADGHHRAASTEAFRQKMIAEKGKGTGEENWDFLEVYAASDHQVRILPYNRVIRKLPMSNDEFMNKISEKFDVKKVEGVFAPKKKHEFGMFMGNSWYKLVPKGKDFGNAVQSLDVSILQNLVIDPILGIKDIRSSENIYFVGEMMKPLDMAKEVVQKGNAVFFSLYPIAMTDIELVADSNEVMPPKSTWFDPKLLSGLVMNPLV
jgi:uncharacterized protein (DUF1015 family)